MEENIEEKYKQKIREALDLSGLSESEQDKIIYQLLNIISSKINMIIFDLLADEEREKFIKFSKNGGESAMEQFLTIKIKNLPEITNKIVNETIEEFKQLAGR